MLRHKLVDQLFQELAGFLAANPEKAEALAQATRDLGPKETLEVVAQVMAETQAQAGRKPKPPGSKACICGRVISGNREYCRACREGEEAMGNGQV